MSKIDHEWEELPDLKPRVKRVRVPGGWIYQVAKDNGGGEWHSPTFVPEQQGGDRG